ncbi:MAG: hypothetical protein EA353_05440 [Puniceicoccaceae bacterium]|nr:MAG: hypothetical protein EA353_05440 [Puniceicoccaceae bacterium]
MLRFSLIILLAMSANLVSASTVRLEYDPSRNVHVEVQQQPGGVLSIHTTGGDPQIVFVVPQGAQIPDNSYILAFEYFCPDGVNSVEIFYQNNRRQGWSQDRLMDGPSLSKAEAWQPYAANLQIASSGKWTPQDRGFRIDFGRAAGLDLQIRNVHLRAPTAAELRGAAEVQARRDAQLEKAARIDAYLDRDGLPAEMASFKVGADAIELSGQIQADHMAWARIIEFLPHEDPWNPDHGTILDERPARPVFSLSLPRYVDGYDRIASRFALARPAENGRALLCRALWATDVSGAAERDMPRLRPANHKGLGGVSYRREIFQEDLEDLGITSATINITLAGLLHQGGRGPKIDFTHQGRTWSFNAQAVARFDERVKRLTEMDIVVSGILLINRGAGVLVHPNYDPAGIYSMANLTDQEGADTFRAVVAFLAERYSRPDKEFGWISHWIVFNEVDYGWVWTNMGETPMELYMDTYEKAMRLTWLEARRFNPTAEVFISLTHNWDYTPSDAVRTYAPRRMLDRLARYSERTGDFHWGVAYHPYPQSLLRPRTWEDTRATASFSTRYITPKNIEVLDAYLHQDHFLYQGEPRTVLLSEQGFHTPDYSEQSMLDKAAAIAYTWAKITHLPSIETFHYHRWVDNPNEGNLRVGLRTLPAPGLAHGERKEPAFSVLSALETEREAEVIEPLKAILGIHDWPSVRVDRSEIDTD